MIKHWRKIGLMVSAVLLAAGCASPSRANSPSIAEDSTAAQKVLLAQSAGEEEGLKLRPVDPVSLKDLHGYKPVHAGRHYDRAVSPDGGKLALVAWPTSDFEDGVLRIIDLDRWEERTADFTLRGPIFGFAFASDGKTLYWLMPDKVNGSTGLTRKFGMYCFGPKDRKPARIARLPVSFEPREMVSLAGGDLAVYGVMGENGKKGVRVYTFDPMNGKIRSMVPLKEITDETVWPTQGDPPVIESHKPAIAWDVRRRMLYIVDGEPERAIQVDLVQGKVIRNEEVVYRSTLWERIFDWFFPGAEAKFMIGTVRKAELSPDGRRLFVVGRKDDVEKGNGDWTQKSEYLELSVIDLGETFEGRRLDLAAEMMKLSPDGRRLLLAGPWSEETGDEGAEKGKRGGLFIVDAERNKVLDRLEPGVIFGLLGFSPDGRLAYVTTDETVKVLDLETRRFMSEGRDGLDLLTIEQRRQ